MKWLVLLLLVSGATASPQVLWEVDFFSTDVEADNGVIAYGEEIRHYSLDGELLETLEPTVVQGTVGTDCDGNEIFYSPNPEPSVAISNHSVAVHQEELLWSVPADHAIEAFWQDGLLVFQSNGTIRKYAMDSECGAAAEWETHGQQIHAAWVGQNIYVHRNDTFFGGFLQALSTEGEALWERVGPTPKDVLETTRGLVIAQTNLKWLNATSGEALAQLPVSTMALAGDNPLFAAGAKLWAIEWPTPTAPEVEEGTDEGTADDLEVIVIPAAGPALFLLLLWRK